MSAIIHGPAAVIEGRARALRALEDARTEMATVHDSPGHSQKYFEVVYTHASALALISIAESLHVLTLEGR